MSDSVIEVVMTPSWTFRGTLSEDGSSLGGTLYIDEQEVLQTYTRVKQWASLLPARMDDKGRAVKSWTYEVPQAVDDGWPVSSLSEAKIRQEPINKLMTQVLKGKYRGVDAVLVAREGKLVLEEYFHFGQRSSAYCGKNS